MAQLSLPLTLTETADYLRVHPRTVQRMLERGELDGFKTASKHGHWRIRVDQTGAPMIRRERA